jgi:hypothetical protein
LSLRVGNTKFRNCKITTKVLFGKKLFVWEILEGAQRPQTEEEKAANVKKKYEIKFSDIDKLDVNTETNVMIFGNIKKCC